MVSSGEPISTYHDRAPALRDQAVASLRARGVHVRPTCHAIVWAAREWLARWLVPPAGRPMVGIVMTRTGRILAYTRYDDLRWRIRAVGAGVPVSTLAINPHKPPEVCRLTLSYLAERAGTTDDDVLHVTLGDLYGYPPAGGVS